MLVRKAAAYDVGIVGYGPTGATLANLLGLCGISTLVIEREAAPLDLPRAVHFDEECMRVFQTIGLAERIHETTHISPGMLFVDEHDDLLVDWSRPMEPGDYGWYHSYRFHQPQLEQILRDGVRRYDCVSVEENCEVTDIREQDGGVSVHFRHLPSGEQHERICRYIIGCDGARSMVRRIMDVQMDDLEFNEQWLVIDLLLKRPIENLGRGDYTIQYCSKTRPATYVRGTGSRRRWEIALCKGEDPEEMVKPVAVWRLLKPWLAEGDAEIERAACYTFRSLVAERWRRGRLLIAGDAAHQTPPFLGQGLCAGIRDAANLAWKLQHVLRHGASATLLDTYESERSPHVREYISLAVRLGRLINFSAPEHVLSAKSHNEEPLRIYSIAPRLGPGLVNNNMAAAGRLAPQPRLSDGNRLDDEVGYNFALLVNGDAATLLSPDLLGRLKKLGIAIVSDSTGAIHGWLDRSGANVALVRPDRYVLGAARTAGELENLLASFDTFSLRQPEGVPA